jgi:HTH-type transcriptional regulator/antitoxin HipB
MHITRSTKQLGVHIRNERIDRGLSQQELADLIGTGQKTISRIENGNEGTKLETIFSIVSALELDIALMARQKTNVSLGEIF